MKSTNRQRLTLILSQQIVFIARDLVEKILVGHDLGFFVFWLAAEYGFELTRGISKPTQAREVA